MIQLHKKYLFVVCMFSLVLVFPAVQAERSSRATKTEDEYRLNPKKQKFLGYSEIGLGAVLMFGLRYPIKAVFSNTKDEFSRGCDQGAASSMGAVGGLIGKLTALAALEAGSVWLIVDGVKNIIKAYERERYSRKY